jgi:hypothetical protein
VDTSVSLQHCVCVCVPHHEFLSQFIKYAAVDLGYHYTQGGNIANIRSHGLLTSADRQTNNVKAAPRGAVFGDGIYTANNSFNFSNYGDTGKHN